MTQKLHRSKEQWLQIIAEWKTSGKSQMAWSQEQGISISAFYKAVNRLEKDNQAPLQRSDFVEIENKQISGLQLNYKGLSVHLSADFDELTLTRFLKVIGDLSC